MKEIIEKDISNCEKLIMKIVWDYEGDIATPDIIEAMRIRYGKNYARSTVVTMIQRLSDKGFVTSYRKGRISYVHAQKDEQKYKESFIKYIEEFWFEGDACNLLSALCKNKKPSKKEIERMRKLIDEMDN